MALYEARTTQRGFDIWNQYNEEIGKFNTLIKRINKEIYVTAHYEILNIEGDSEKRTKVKGELRPCKTTLIAGNSLELYIPQSNLETWISLTV